MRILYIGDIMGEAGIQIVEQVLPDILRIQPDTLVLGQAENVTDGKGMSVAHMERLQKAGMHFFTGGNHTPASVELHSYLEDSTKPVIGPANMSSCPGQGWKYIDTAEGKVLIISLLGSTVGREIEIDNPLQAIDKILAENKDIDRIATVVNFHGDYSSEKVIIGEYLDGRVSMVVGDHWHVQTADERILKGGTAHITDVGMCGTLNSSLGVKFDSVIPRWRDAIQTKNELETQGPKQFCALFVELNSETTRAQTVTRLRKIID